MTPRQLVTRTLQFDSPPRLPRQLWLLPWATLHHGEAVAAIQRRFPDDLVHAPACWTVTPKTAGDPYRRGTFIDEWGCAFQNIQDGLIGEVKRPLLADWSALQTLRPPIECLSVDVEAVNRFCRGTDRFVLAACCPRLFERMQFLRGTENLLIDLLDQPSELLALLKIVHAFYLDELTVWANTEVDALMFMDDWGGQRSLLISPDLWRELFKPLYRQYIDLAHARNKYAFMHSDGYILDILPDLVELGLDAVNSQIFCMDLPTLGDRFAGTITFWGELDRQHLLPHGSRRQIIDAAKSMRRHLHRHGGLIAQCEFGAGARPENVLAFFEALADHDRGP
jgi:uroporphyrinogen decarboxylase